MRFFKKSQTGIAGGLLFFATSLPAHAQNAGAAVSQQDIIRETLMSLGAGLIPVAIAGVFLLIARRNMHGWNVPLKWTLFSLKGRMNRKAYWLKGIIPLMMISFGFQVAMGLTMLPIILFMGEKGAILSIVAMIVFLVPLVVLQGWAGVALSIKRIHDRGRSAWFLLLMAIPFLNLWLLVELWFLRGSQDDNKFGPDPLVDNPYAVDNAAAAPTMGTAAFEAPSPTGKKSFFTKPEHYQSAAREQQDSRTIIQSRLGPDMFPGGDAPDKDEE